MVYLDNAATTFPKPPTVARAMKACIDGWCGNPGRGAHPLAAKSAEAVYGVRAKIASMFSGKSENVVFAPNATFALNYAIKALVPRGHVIISDIEHNAVVRPIFGAGLRYSIFGAFSPVDRMIADIRAKIRPDTRALIVNAASNLCPLTLPLTELGTLCREQNLYLIVDGSQYVGGHRVDIGAAGIDALCAPGHKGLYGPQGSGFVLFSDRAAQTVSQAPTLIEGGNGVNSREPFMPRVLPERMEAGTLSVPNIVGLGAGIDFVQSQGCERILMRESALYESLLSVLARTHGITVYAPGLRRGNVLLFNIDGKNSEDTARELAQAGICVRAGLHCAPLAHAALGTPEHGAVRVSFGAFNTEEDVAYLLSVLGKMV